MLAPVVGYYNDPVVTLDFGSLYPSVMCELNVCKSTQVTREYAKEHAMPFLQPPAPSLSGIWLDAASGARVARVEEASDADVKVYLYASKRTFSGAYADELNEALKTPVGTAVLEDGGYALAWPDGARWVRRNADVMCFVDPSVREGNIPRLERTLKLDRKAAKKKMAAASVAGDEAGEAFFENLQNGIKVIMNALYGGLGSGKGGIFPESAPLASAITSRGRSLIVLVKKTLELRFWLAGSVLGGLEDAPHGAGAPRPDGAKALQVVYGDTDSCMIHFPQCTLQQAAQYGAALSKFFGTHMLKEPHVLEFEKVLFPCAFYKKKMYAAAKYEDYGGDAKPKVWARGLSAVRRDNALLVRNTVTEVMDLLFKHRTAREDIIAWLGQRLADVHNSAAAVHAPPGTPFCGATRFTLADFIQSAGISKELNEFDAPNAAVAVARQMLVYRGGHV